MKEDSRAGEVRKALSAIAKTGGEDMQLLLQRYASERFLYRLSRSPHRTEFVLKGAMLFAHWSDARHRSTRDIDLLGFGIEDEPRARSIFLSVLEQEQVDDGLTFYPESLNVSRIRVAKAYGGFRLTFRASLGKARIPLQVDIGIGDHVVGREEPLRSLLDLPSPVIRIYPRVSVVAEKTEAMIQLDIYNSRMKDFFDIRYLAEGFEFSGPDLAEALRVTFERRGTDLPASGTDELFARLLSESNNRAQWAGFLRKAQAAVDWTYEETLEEVQRFICEPLKALVSFEPFKKSWSPKGPWE